MIASFLALGFAMVGCGDNVEVGLSGTGSDSERSSSMPPEGCEEMAHQDFGRHFGTHHTPLEAARSVLPSADEGLEEAGGDYVVIVEGEILARVHVDPLEPGLHAVSSLETCDEYWLRFEGYVPGALPLDYPTTRPDPSAISDAFHVVPIEWLDGDGNVLPEGVAWSHRGVTGCGWQSAIFLRLGWPLGTAATGFDDVRQYVRDPDGVVGPSSNRGDGSTIEVDAAFEVGVELPADAVDTGYQSHMILPGDTRLDTVSLFISESEAEQAVYIDTADGFERWPATEVDQYECGPATPAAVLGEG